MSGYIREKDELRARALGITDLHWKPNSVEELAQILRTRIGESGHGE
jgi:CheY-like chemotaxis protein